jgi:hypothetical protein
MLTEIDLATTIVRRWNHVLDLEWQARNGNEAALRRRMAAGLRSWLL